MILRNDVGTWELQDGRVRRLTLKGDRTAVVLDPAPRSKVSQHINDPRFGGLGCFGVHVARRNEFFPDPARVADWTWDLTERMVAKDNGGYGVTYSGGPVDAWYSEISDGESYPDPILSIERTYEVGPRSLRIGVVVEVVWDGSGSPLYFKEPKLVCHSLRGYRWLDVLISVGSVVPIQHDLSKLPKPSVKTLQLRGQRKAVRFTGSKPPLVFHFESRGGWDKWRNQADAAEPLLPMTHEQAYCQQGPPNGHLTSAWEAAHWPGTQVAGVMLHAWEGGSGYTDCLSCFRPAVPGERYGVALTVEVR